MEAKKQRQKLKAAVAQALQLDTGVLEAIQALDANPPIKSKAHVYEMSDSENDDEDTSPSEMFDNSRRMKSQALERLTEASSDLQDNVEKAVKARALDVAAETAFKKSLVSVDKGGEDLALAYETVSRAFCKLQRKHDDVVGELSIANEKIEKMQEEKKFMRQRLSNALLSIDLET
jgi:hypothetical protein